MPKGEGQPRKIQEVWVRTIADVLKMLRPGEDEESIFMRQSAEVFIAELRQPTASAERTPTFEEFVLMAELHKMRIADGKTVIGSLALWHNEMAALHSAPSSPPQYITSVPDPQGRTIASGMAQGMATWAAEPSDAGRPRCTTCWALLPCKVHQPQPLTCEKEQD